MPRYTMRHVVAGCKLVELSRKLRGLPGVYRVSPWSLGWCSVNTKIVARDLAPYLPGLTYPGLDILISQARSKHVQRTEARHTEEKRRKTRGRSVELAFGLLGEQREKYPVLTQDVKVRLAIWQRVVGHTVAPLP